MEGMEARLEPVEGITEGGMLAVKGPNIMLGYLHAENPGAIDPPPGGWYRTGDVVSIDEDGFITIRGRVKRFAKIGGETISLAVVENCAAALWPDNHHAAIALPAPPQVHGSRGEEIVLVTDAAEARRMDLVAWAQNHGVSATAIPRRILVIPAVPTLATGKTDYVAVEKLARAEMPLD
jgi:acyl-[acyl-carrier-protein]-phospholipid O-acyltransferase/long-chain-fatty-acid--[acyl-carrier-protein] ligase